MKNYSSVLGIDVGGHNIKAGWLNGGDVREFRKVSIRVEEIISELLSVISEYKAGKDDIIGIGFPGFVGDGIVSSPPNLPTIDEINLEQMIKEKTGSSVAVINDADAVILGEALYGAGMNYNIVVGFTLGTGVGGGIIIDKKIFSGDRGSTAEFGHMIIDHDGPFCNCGKKGCLESFIGAYAITGQYKELSGESISVKDIFKRALNDDIDAKKIVDDYGYFLSIGVNNIVEILNPDVVVLAGGVSRSGRQIIKSMKSKGSIVTRLKEEINIKISQLGDRAGPVGAASWAYKKFQE